MRIHNKIKLKIVSLEIALILIGVSTICFYTLSTILPFVLMNVLAGIICIWHYIQYQAFKIKVHPFLIWITLIFAIFMVYGTFFLRNGAFNADRFAIAYLQCLLLYYAMKRLMTWEKQGELIARCMAIISVICMAILMLEMLAGQSVIREDGRIGDSLSGNVNTVGSSFGILSIFIFTFYGLKRRKLYLVIGILLSLLILATGSKQALVLLLIDVGILYICSRNKAIGGIGIVLISSLFLFLIFSVDFFYNIIGYRIVDMLGQFGFKLGRAHYSNSTAARITMIQEGFQFWREHPLFGGGMNYFAARTSTYYAYSHCNVTELLCNMGIFVAACYYFPHVWNLSSYRKWKKKSRIEAMTMAGLLVSSLILDWMMVSYSSICIFYIPIIYSFIVREKIKQGMLTKYEKDDTSSMDKH